MVVVLRWTAFLLGVGGLFETARLGHQGNLRAALMFFLFDTAAILVFVLSHVIVEWFLEGLEMKGRRR